MTLIRLPSPKRQQTHTQRTRARFTRPTLQEGFPDQGTPITTSNSSSQHNDLIIIIIAMASPFSPPPTTYHHQQQQQRSASQGKKNGDDDHGRKERMMNDWSSHTGVVFTAEMFATLTGALNKRLERLLEEREKDQAELGQ